MWTVPPSGIYVPKQDQENDPEATGHECERQAREQKHKQRPKHRKGQPFNGEFETQDLTFAAAHDEYVFHNLGGALQQ